MNHDAIQPGSIALIVSELILQGTGGVWREGQQRLLFSLLPELHIRHNLFLQFLPFGRERHNRQA